MTEYTIIEDATDEFICKAKMPERPTPGDLVELPGLNYIVGRVSFLVLESEEPCDVAMVLYVNQEVE